jgi:predicted oxidoreductase
MKTYRLGTSDLNVSRIGYGCMGIGGTWDDVPLNDSDRKKASKILHVALDTGINFFDHADIYCHGKSEEAFAELWKESSHLRQEIYIQTKCGIRFAPPLHRFDFSYEHIIASVEKSLKRLRTDYIDVLLLHRPDPLVEPEEVSHAFDELKSTGKVRWFGVSNHTAAQIDLLRKFLDHPIIVNQVEFNLVHTQLLDEGIVFNQNNLLSTRNEGVMEYCRLNNITLQAWAPLANGWITGNPKPDAPKNYLTAEKLVTQLAVEKRTSPEAIIIAWILRHPAQIQPLPGTTNPKRILAACEAEHVDLTREEWYHLFVAGRGENLP